MKNSDKNFYANFYETYIKYACMQWLQRAFLYKELVQLIGEDISMLEIGPGTGDVAALIAQSVTRSGKVFSYRSIDKLAEYAHAPQERLRAVGAHAISITRDDAFTYPTGEILTQDVQLEPGQKFDLILCEHVLYGLLAKHGTSEVASAALKPYFEALSKYGLFVNVLSDKSDSDALRIRSASVQAPIDIYRTLMRNQKGYTFEVPVSAELLFPSIDLDFWNKLATGSYDYASESKCFKDAHDLVTFFGSNLEQMRESGQVQDYLHRFQKLLREKNGKMTLNVVVFISTASDSEEFVKALARAIAQAEIKLKAYAPVTLVDLDKVRILPHLHN